MDIWRSKHTLNQMKTEANFSIIGVKSSKKLVLWTIANLYLQQSREMIWNKISTKCHM